MDIYVPPSLDVEFRLQTISTWHDHLPFGYDLVAELRPKKLVELGTHTGLSFFCFCQAVAENNIDGTCYAIDTWTGDKHAGSYANTIYQSVDDHVRDYYRGIAYLMRMTFDEASPHFDANSLDILHIDGLHTYDAVKQDFEVWYEKVAPGGIILFHDIEARMNDYGVWQFWQELETNFQTFAFRHGYGLGVLRKPGSTSPPGQLLRLLFDSTEETKARLRKFYVHISRHLDAIKKVRDLTRERKARI
jgi:predicted O-methyltransferase YrrM